MRGEISHNKDAIIGIATEQADTLKLIMAKFSTLDALRKELLQRGAPASSAASQNDIKGWGIGYIKSVPQKKTR